MGIFDKIFKGKTNKSDAELLKEEEELNIGLEKTKQGFFSKISKVVAGKSEVDIEFLDELEEILISSDVSLPTTIKIIDRLEARVAKDKYINTKELNSILKNEIAAILEENNTKDIVDFTSAIHQKPYVMMVVGVNGVGKTTTIGKLAYQFKKAGKNVVLGAADTFRAAAVDQLVIWSERVGVDIVKQNMGSDPAAVAFDTIQSGVAKNADIIIIDTAGRLHNKVGLMEELAKIKKVMSKVIPDAPHEVLLVLDASTGQNALEQAKHFSTTTQVTALALTKLDGTAKGGIILSIADELQIPIKYIGLGEKMEQLQTFNKVAFIETLFK
jgi:fused signal recognition particle receptor